MKRFVGILLVIVMVAGCVSAVGERRNIVSSESRKKTAQEYKTYDYMVVKALLDIYDDEPEKADADHLYMLYSYLMSYCAFEDILTAESFLMLHYKVELDEKTFFTEDTRKLFSFHATTYETLVDAFSKWMNGESTDEEMLKTLSTYGHMIIEKEEAKKEK